MFYTHKESEIDCVTIEDNFTEISRKYTCVLKEPIPYHIIRDKPYSYKLVEQNQFKYDKLYLRRKSTSGDTPVFNTIHECIKCTSIEIQMKLSHFRVGGGTDRHVCKDYQYYCSRDGKPIEFETYDTATGTLDTNTIIDILGTRYKNIRTRPDVLEAVSYTHLTLPTILLV